MTRLKHKQMWALRKQRVIDAQLAANIASGLPFSLMWGPGPGALVEADFPRLPIVEGRLVLEAQLPGLVVPEVAEQIGINDEGRPGIEHIHFWDGEIKLMTNTMMARITTA